jgi:hypothetical protein
LSVIIGRVYVFGGGSALKMRYNDTIKFDLTLKVMSTVNVIGSVPVQRTYHSSAIMGKYMFIMGGEARHDLDDLYALDLET